jgi:hypothetical protein
MLFVEILSIIWPIIGLRQKKAMLVFHRCYRSQAIAFVLEQVCEPKQRPGDSGNTMGKTQERNTRRRSSKPGLSAGHFLSLLNQPITALSQEVERLFRRHLLVQTHDTSGATSDSRNNVKIWIILNPGWKKRQDSLGAVDKVGSLPESAQVRQQVNDTSRSIESADFAFALQVFR